MKKKDSITSIILLIFSGVLYYYASTFPVREGRVRVLNAGFYPRLLAIVLAILALLLLISTIRKKPDGKESEKGKEFWTSRKSLILFFITFVMLVVYSFLLNILGFAAATLLFVLILVYNLSDKEKFKIRNIVLVSTGITTIIYLVFKVFINIPFPQGYLF